MNASYILLLFLYSLGGIAQKNKGIVNYGYIEALGNGGANGMDYMAYLVFTNDRTYYVTAKDSLETEANIAKQKLVAHQKKGGSIYNGMKVSPQGDQVFHDLKTKEMRSNFLMIEQIYVKESTPVFNWKLHPETKKIGKFSCHKATAYFRGRNYTAWYTLQIAVPYGPWKFNGLPGLILEAYDNEKFTYWYFKGIEYPSSRNINADYIKKAKGEKHVNFLTLPEFAKKRLALQKLTEEKQILVQKQYDGVIFEKPQLSLMFIEFE